mgnify:CR=1 FL=1
MAVQLGPIKPVRQTTELVRAGRVPVIVAPALQDKGVDGIRPLTLGQVGDDWVVASETCAFDLLGATYVRDVEPGEIVIIDNTGLRSLKPFRKVRPAHCIFELVYFARPDSHIFGQNVYLCRKRFGHQLAKATFVIVAVIVGLGLLRGQPFIEMLVFGIALVPYSSGLAPALSIEAGRFFDADLTRFTTDGGTTWTTAKQTATLTTSELTYILGSTSDTWGRAWTSSNLSNTNFRVRVIDVASGSGASSRDFSLDYIAVNVTYQP